MGVSGGMASGFKSGFHSFRDADDSHFFCVDEGAALGGGASDFVTYEEFGEEMEGGFVKGVHPHAGGNVFVCEDDSLFVVDAGVDYDWGYVFCGHFFEGVIVVEEFESEVFEPAYVDGVVNVSDEVDVVCFDADIKFCEKGSDFAHGVSYCNCVSLGARPQVAGILLFLGVAYCAIHVAFCLLCFEGVPFVCAVFTFAEANLDFDFSSFEVDAEGDEGHASFVNFASDSDDLVFVHEKFSGAFGFVVVYVALFVGRDVGVFEEHFAAVDVDIAVFEDQVPCAQGFYFGSLECDAGLVGVNDDVVVVGAFIFCYEVFVHGFAFWRAHYTYNVSGC